MRKVCRLYTILCIAFVTLLALPWLQMKSHLLPLRPLQGAFVPTETKALTWQSWRDGSWQQSAEESLADHFGFREWAIRTYNQCVWSCFGRSTNSQVRIGRDGWLFHVNDVREHYAGVGCDYAADSATLMQAMERDVRNLYRLQEALRQCGTNLFVCIAPSKSHTYPELLPASPAEQCNGFPKAYPYLTERMNDVGIHCIDFNAYFAQLKGNAGYPLYYKASSHWTNLAVCHIGDTLLRYMEQLGGCRLPRLLPGKAYEAPARIPDDNLLQLANIWRSGSLEHYLYADMTVIADSDYTRPRLLAMGDSYGECLHNCLPFEKLFSRYRYWYYCHTIQHDPLHDEVAQTDLLDELLGNDYVMVVWSPANIYNLGHGIPERALVALCVNDSVVALRFRQEAAAIQSDPAQIKLLRQRAETCGSRLGRVISDEIYDRFYRNPEHYFEALRGNGTPTVCNRHDEIRRQIQSDHRWSEYVRRKAEELLISREEAYADEAEWVRQHPHPSAQEQAVKAKVIDIYCYGPWLDEVRHKGGARHLDLDQAVWAEARAITNNQ